MEPFAEVTDAAVRLVRGRVAREEGCRLARPSLAVVVEAPRRLGTCGGGRRSRAFEGWRLPPRGAVADGVPPCGGFPLSLDLPLPRSVFLRVQADRGQLDFEL